MAKKKYTTIGEGFKHMPKAIGMYGKWWKVDPEAWELIKKLELQEVQKKKMKKVM